MNSICFKDIPNLPGNNWGWCNGPYEPDSMGDLTFYRGAGDCEPDPAKEVGTLSYTHSTMDNKLTLVYNMDTGFKIDEAQLSVSTILTSATTVKCPIDDDDDLTNAPGQFNENGVLPEGGEFTVPLCSFTATVCDVDGPFGFAAHIVACNIPTP